MKHRRYTLGKVLVVLALLLGTGWYRSVQAGGTVTDCTRYNAPGGLEDALAGGGTVQFACSGTLEVDDIVLTTNTILDATGYEVVLSGADSKRILTVNGGVQAQLIHLTLAQGGGGAGGGAVINRGTLLLIDTTVRNSSSRQQRDLPAYGGGILNTGALELRQSRVEFNSASLGGGIATRGGTVGLLDSTVEGNTATANGGGLSNSSGTITSRNSTLIGNGAMLGGALEMTGGRTNLINSTISGNSASGSGGALAVRNGTLSTNYTTITQNQAVNGGGVFRNAGVVTITNSIVANQISGSDCAGTLTVGPANLDSDGTCDQATTGDANLEPLANNGGATLTFLPQPNSVVIDHADTTNCPATDQRGVARPTDGNNDGVAACDLGAVEVAGPLGSTATPFLTASTTSTPTALPVGTATSTVLPVGTAATSTAPPVGTTATATGTLSPVSTTTVTATIPPTRASTAVYLPLVLR